MDCGTIVDCCEKRSGLPKNADDSSGYWGSIRHTCDLPPKTFDQVVMFIKEKVKPDYIIWLGDNTDHKIWLSDQKRHSNFTSYISQKLQKELSDIPIFPVLGNHELLPVDVFNFEDNAKHDGIYPLTNASEDWKNF